MLQTPLWILLLFGFGMIVFLLAMWWRTWAALRRSEQKYRCIVESSHDIIYTLRADGIFTFVSASWTVLLGHELAEVIGHPFQPFVHPDDVLVCEAFLAQAVATGQRQSGAEYRVRHQDGTWHWHLSNLAPVRNPSGHIVAYVGAARDITEYRRMEEKLRASETRFRSLLEQTPSIAVQGYDPDGTVRYWNSASKTFYGYSASEAIGRNILDLIIPPEMHKGFEQVMQGMATTGQVPPMSELSLRCKDGRQVAVLSSQAVIQIPGKGVELFCLDMDITDRKQMEKELRRLAISDSLTGLFNRRHFFTLAQQEYERFRRYRRPLAFMMADIDHFKTINDRHGHLIGDQVLQAVASILQGNLRQVDILARYGGEEFAMALPEADAATARASAERLRAAIADTAIATTHGPLSLTLSLGVAAISQGAPISFEHLLDTADQMLYQAKQAGRNCVVVREVTTDSAA